MSFAYNQAMQRLSFILLLVMMFAACRSADPEAGTPLRLAEQVTVSAFEQFNPTVLAWANLMPDGYTPSYQEFPWTVEDSEGLMQKTLQETPFIKELDGQDVQISGYVVPLDGTYDAISEFLLVPFLGACTHVPPPPANQIVYVKPMYPLPVQESWDVVSVVGTLKTQGATSNYGAASYQMLDSILTKFDESSIAGVIKEPVVVDGVGASNQPLVPPITDR